MARRAALLLRMLLSFALVVAALPLRAGAPPCAPPARAAMSAMPCCAGKAMAMACCRAKPAQGSALDCRCELKAPFDLPATEAKAALPTSFGLLIVLPAELPAPFVGALLVREPGVSRTDSSPPGTVPRRPDASRAPPVVRV